MEAEHIIIHAEDRFSWRQNMLYNIINTYKYDTPEKHIERARIYEAYVFEPEPMQAEIIQMEIVK